LPPHGRIGFDRIGDRSAPPRREGADPSVLPG
jgi:hypothetical protein